jgi:hypothetical protein
VREFGSANSRASALSLPARILYTVFAVLVLAGCFSCAVIYDSFVHFDARSTPQQLDDRLVQHYQTIDRQKLVETTHAHLFIMPLLLLVAGHLFLLSSASMRVKLAAIIAGSLTTTLHLLAPWLIVWTNGAAAGVLVYPISGGFLLLTTALLLVLPVWEMWRR